MSEDKKHWRPLRWDECGNCGSDNCETYTDAPDGWHYDGDAVRCKECGEEGQIMCDTESPSDVFWNGRDFGE